MQSFALYLINIFTASIFLMLWRAKPDHRYFLYWGLALFAIPATQATAFWLLSLSTPHPLVYLGFATAAALMLGGLMLGVLSFRELGFSKPLMYGLLPMSAALILVLAVVVPVRSLVAIVGLFTTGAFLVAGLSLWSRNVIARIMASMFLLKAVMAIFFAIGKDTPVLAQTFDYVAPLAASVYLVQAIYLLTKIFKSINDELRANLTFMGLASAVSKSAQNAVSQQDLASEVLRHMIGGDFWDGGMVYKVNRDSHQLIQTGHEGAGSHIPDVIDLAGTITEQVLRSKELLITSPEALGTVVAPKIQKIHSSQETITRLIILIPLVDRDETEGVMILFRSNQREVISREKDTLRSIGHIVGLAQAKLSDRELLAIKAAYDSLTGLGNRSRFHEYCRSLMATDVFWVMLFDLNDFKGINDVFGHAVGDQFLINLSRRLLDDLPEGATAFRLGGDEFVVVFAEKDQRTVESEQAELLSTLIKEPVLIEDFALRSSAAIGVASSLLTADSHELLRYADLAMYEAKKIGQPIVYYHEALAAVSTERMNLLVEIERAIEQDELEMFYQPVMSLGDSSLVKCEALARWHHPQKGLIEAVEFMPWVESSPVIDTLTLDIIAMVAKDLKQFSAQGVEMVVSVNLSARNMIDSRLPARIDQVLANHGVASERLHLEITETGLMRDLAAAQAVAAQLVQRGYSLVIDDFGAGQSSLAYLSRFAVAEVKIDKGFVLKMQADDESLRLVKAIVELVHKLGFKATAEGVENESTMNELAAIGCDFAQGYHYAKPMQKGDFSAWYNRHF